MRASSRRPLFQHFTVLSRSKRGVYKTFCCCAAAEPISDHHETSSNFKRLWGADLLKHEDITSARVERITSSQARVHPSQYKLWGKRALDIALAVLLLPILAPAVLAMLLIVSRDGAPGLFGHTRVGQNGHKFTCFKIRTMVPDAEAQLEQHLANDRNARKEWAETQKLTNDPRITPIGRFLRKTSLDELPQIWNVIKGDMSFVGPRPVTADELNRYGLHVDMYLQMKPGVTGVWQVEGRSNGCYEERLKMDRRYSQNLTLATDLMLILKTALVVIRPTGR